MNATHLENNYNFYMETEIGKFIGEWVAISEDKIVSHGKDLKKVAEEAKKICGSKKFLLARVPDKETMIF